MKAPKLFRLLPLLTAGAIFATGATSFADRKVTVYRDRDGDGHYNKKTYKVPDRYRSSYYRGGGNYYYNNRPYGYYRPYSYGYRPYYYSAPSVSFYYSRPSTAVYTRSSSYYSDDLAADVQRELRRRGYYYGEIDGDVGPGTRAAIRAYQADRGFVVTGRIDRNLVRALGVG